MNVSIACKEVKKMSFTVYPAIDIRDGKCVRLFQGDYNLESRYYMNPLEPAQKWAQAGARWLHIIDLDGARTGKPENLPLIKEIINQVKVNIQIGGGLRTWETVESYLEAGAKRVILGSVAFKDPSLVKRLLETYGPEKIIVSLDSRKDRVYSDGWLSQASSGVLEVAQRLAQLGIKTFIYTDIEKDGTLTGPNIEKSLELAQKTKCNVIVAGGIGSGQDILDLIPYYQAGLKGAVVGRALYTGNINLKELIAQIERGN